MTLCYRVWVSGPAVITRGMQSGPDLRGPRTGRSRSPWASGISVPLTSTWPVSLVFWLVKYLFKYNI